MTSNKTNFYKSSVFFSWVICIVATMFYCYELILRVEPSLMLSDLMQQFKINAGKMGTLVSFYYIAYTPMQLVVGMLVDRFGTRIILVFAIIFCVGGNFLFSIANNFCFGASGRFLIGFGSAFAFVSAMKLAAEWLPKNRFALFAGFVTALGMGTGMLGYIIFPVLIQVIGWRFTLHLITVVGIVLIPIIWFFIHDTSKWKATYVDAVSFKEAFSCFWKMAKNKQMWLAGFIACLFYLSLSVFAELWGIPFLRAVYNLPPKTAAFACSMVFAGWLFGSPLNGWLSDRIRARRLPLIFAGFFSAITISLIVFKPFAIAIWQLYALLFLFGIFSSAEILCFAIGRENNSHRFTAMAIGCINTLCMLGGVIFQPLVGILLDVGWHGKIIDGVKIYTDVDFQRAIWILPVLVLLGSGLALLLKESYYNNEH
jgi:MFS family permease